MEADTRHWPQALDWPLSRPEQWRQVVRCFQAELDAVRSLPKGADADDERRDEPEPELDDPECDCELPSSSQWVPTFVIKHTFVHVPQTEELADPPIARAASAPALLQAMSLAALADAETGGAHTAAARAEWDEWRHLDNAEAAWTACAQPVPPCLELGPPIADAAEAGWTAGAPPPITPREEGAAEAGWTAGASLRGGILAVFDACEQANAISGSLREIMDENTIVIGDLGLDCIPMNAEAGWTAGAELAGAANFDDPGLSCAFWAGPANFDDIGLDCIPSAAEAGWTAGAERSDIADLSHGCMPLVAEAGWTAGAELTVAATADDETGTEHYISPVLLISSSPRAPPGLDEDFVTETEANDAPELSEPRSEDNNFFEKAPTERLGAKPQRRWGRSHGDGPKMAVGSPNVEAAEGLADAEIYLEEANVKLAGTEVDTEAAAPLVAAEPCEVAAARGGAPAAEVHEDVDVGLPTTNVQDGIEMPRSGAVCDGLVDAGVGGVESMLGAGSSAQPAMPSKAALKRLRQQARRAAVAGARGP